MQRTRLTRPLSKAEYKTWRRLEKQLQREGLGAIDANIDATGWTFARPSNGDSATILSYSPDRTDSEGGHVLGLDLDNAAARRTFGGDGTVADTDTACAVDRLCDAARLLPDFCGHCRLIQDWAETGNAKAAAKRNGFRPVTAHDLIQKFLAWSGLVNPYSRKTSEQVQAEADPLLCQDPVCSKRLGPHSRHGAAKKVAKYRSGHTGHRAIPPKQDRQQYLRDYDRRLQELRRNG
jgi:hypothetical protein